MASSVGKRFCAKLRWNGAAFGQLHRRIHASQPLATMLCQHEDRHANVWTFSDGRLLCTISDERRISGDFYAAVCNERLALICGKTLKIYDLSVHAGYKRAVSEGLGVSLRFLIDPAEFSHIAQEAAGKAGACNSSQMQNRT